ncbi:YbgA family protein [Enterococcus sp. AZ177]|uniref:YbgA family protein n=1 Tax=unclassified Enterococcus TaxID=2608891 RepID=UPI003D2FCE48
MKRIAQRQQEWSSLKYLILSKSQPDYRAIRKLFADDGWDEAKEQAFRGYLKHALAEPNKKGNLLNAYQHVWGYFKKQATETERQQYEVLSVNFSVDQDALSLFLRELTLKYQEPYLLQSALLFPKEEN